MSEEKVGVKRSEGERGREMLCCWVSVGEVRERQEGSSTLDILAIQG